MAIWDVSQNVDRLKADLGMVPCITPGGCDFSSHRGTALNGSQLLLLQGMPMTKLHFARESQRDCQDLAGNALSTTVIGASLISGIISGRQGFQLESEKDPSPEIPRGLLAAPDARVIEPKMRPIEPPGCKSERIDVSLLKADAMQGARFCECEGDIDICGSPVHVCSSCGHTACAKCAGSPRHNYSEKFSNKQRLLTPDEFIHRWKPQLPTRLRFRRYPDIRQLISRCKPFGQSTKEYFNHLTQIDVSSQHFCIRAVLRQDNGWKIVYKSDHATLELRIGSLGLEWLLYVTCPAALPGNSAVRKLFAHPVAQAEVKDHLTNVDWKVHLPRPRTHKVQVNGSSQRHASWRSQLGLPDYKSETVPASLHFHTQDEDCEFLNGDIDLLPDCGTASNSLYKRLGGVELYLLLDSGLTGRAEDDGFVFAPDPSRKQYGYLHIPSAYVNASWRPWQVKDQLKHLVDIIVPGIWVPATMTLDVVEPALTVNLCSDGKTLTNIQKDCAHAVLVLDAQLQESLPVENFHDYAWALQHVKTLPSFTEWQACSVKSQDKCLCAPSLPCILWHVERNGVATPHEDRKAATSFGRAISKYICTKCM